MAMPKLLVYIPQICREHDIDDTFLHFSWTERTRAYRLRRYPTEHECIEIEQQSQGRNADDILQMARTSPGCREEVRDARDVNDTRFWFERIQKLNRKYNIGTGTGGPVCLNEQCKAHLQKVEAELQNVTEQWGESQANFQRTRAELQQAKGALSQSQANLEQTKSELVATRAALQRGSGELEQAQRIAQEARDELQRCREKFQRAVNTFTQTVKQAFEQLKRDVS
jgi:septation ring formation regulator EzrA